MPSPDQETYLVAYDVSRQKRRTRIAKRLSQVGLRVNLSVFEVRVASGALEVLLEDLRRLIKPDQDHIRVYPICARCRDGARILGRPKPLCEAAGIEEV